MSFILSCFWFCCGSANDDPADRYHQPPPPSSQTQMVAVVQAPPVQQQPSHHQMPPPPQTSPYWPHVPPTKSYDPPPFPEIRQPSSAAPAPTMVSPQAAVPPRRVPSKSHDQSLLPSAETTTPPRAPLPSTKGKAQEPAQAPWPARQPSNAAAIQQAVPPNNKVLVALSKRYDETLVAAVAPTTQTPPRATSSVVHNHDPSPRVPSMKMKAYDEPPPSASVVPSQRLPQTAWPTHQPSKTYQAQPEPAHQVPSKTYDTPWPAVVPVGNLNGYI